MVEVSVTVGKLDASLALLLTKDHHLIEFPTLLLPNDVEAGSIVKISCERDVQNEKQDKQAFDTVQNQILTKFGVNEPSTPALRVRNTTQTSVVLEWDPINPATADVLSLTLYRNNQRFGLITHPLKRTSTKISGLAIDFAYTFHLVLATTAGIYYSEKVTVKTHKMTDLSGITICVGDLSGSQIDREELAKTASKIGAKPLQDHVKVDTTHFVCTIGKGDEWKRAQDLNIPVVTPEWVKACETERRLVGVKRYYLDADPKDRAPLQRSRAQSQTTTGSDTGSQQPPAVVPKITTTEAESEQNNTKTTQENDIDKKELPNVPEEDSRNVVSEATTEVQVPKEEFSTVDLNSPDDTEDTASKTVKTQTQTQTPVQEQAQAPITPEPEPASVPESVQETQKSEVVDEQEAKGSTEEQSEPSAAVNDESKELEQPSSEKAEEPVSTVDEKVEEPVNTDEKAEEPKLEEPTPVEQTVTPQPEESTPVEQEPQEDEELESIDLERNGTDETTTTTTSASTTNNKSSNKKKKNKNKKKK